VRNFVNTLEQLKIVIVGHVDHGKSTFVGRLFYDTGSLPEGKYEQLVEVAKRRGVPFEFANLMDALQAERDQNITIDTAQIWFRTPKRQYVIIDAPGHKEFLKNMITGAANAHAALLLIDANEGIQEQSKRHGYLLHLLGIQQVIVLVNKMDLKNHDQKVFDDIERDYRKFLGQLGVTPKMFIPMSAKNGDNVASRSPSMAWYKGLTVLEALDQFEVPKPSPHLPLRFPIQDVYRFDHRRILAGRIESGSLKVGDRLYFWPSGKSSTINTIERWSSPTSLSASAGESIGVTLTEQIFVERGQVASHESETPSVDREFKANLFWMGRANVEIGKKYKLKLTTQELECEVKSIEKIIDASTLAEVGKGRNYIARNDVAELTFKTRMPIALDNHQNITSTGRFVIVDAREVSGGGIISGVKYAEKKEVKSDNITWSQGEVLPQERAARNAHQGAVVWLTGLSGAGKSTIAVALERELFNRGMQAYVLDGDNLRYGLNANLGFSKEDRSENIRRAAEVAKLFADAGFVVITSLISPYRADRARVREIMVEGQIPFFEMFINCPLEVCEQRDPKNLYSKARSGEIKEFTGISSPYEPPEKPELTLQTSKQTPQESVAVIIDYLLQTSGIIAQGYDI
jgi:bifunctional enzyme CysN/CysC